jgi:hypothetical protein
MADTNQFLRKECIEILLPLLSGCALALGIPAVNNAHAQQTSIHPHRPVQRSKLSLEHQVILSAPIVPINHPAGIIVELSSLWLRNLQRDSLWCGIRLFAHLPPTVSGVLSSWPKGRRTGNEIAPVTVHPTKGKHRWNTIPVLSYNPSHFPSVSHLNMR